MEFAKQLATVNEQPFWNGFQEMIQWMQEGNLGKSPVSNEAGFDSNCSEFHEDIFLDELLENFPKRGLVRHFMELWTCVHFKNSYLRVKQNQTQMVLKLF